MSNTSSRTLRLLSLLQTRRYWLGADLAERLAVSERTVRRDIDRLRELGYPVEAQRGVDGGYQLAAGVSLPPLVLDDEEAIALAVGLQIAVQGHTVAGIAEAAVRVLTKIAQVMPSRLRRQVDAVAAMTIPTVWGPVEQGIDSTLLVTIALACRDSERLEFDYTTREGAFARRQVQPNRLVLLERRWYLVAWDLGRFDWRNFRLDRLINARSTGARFHSRELPSGDAAAFLRRGIENLATRYAVEVHIEARAEVVRSHVGSWANVTDNTDNSCTLHMSCDTLDWPLMVLGRIGANFEVLSPLALLETVHEWADRFARSTNRRRIFDETDPKTGQFS